MGIMDSPISKTQFGKAALVEPNQQQGLAAQSAAVGSGASANNSIPMGGVNSASVTGGGTTSVPGITNPAANSIMSGNMTNGNGLAAMANSSGLQPQQNANQYSIVGGANMMV